MGGGAWCASSITFADGSLGFPSEQLLLLLLGPFRVVVGHLHVHARLLAELILVAVLGTPD